MADPQQQTAEQALAQSGLKVDQLSPQQQQEILAQISQQLPQTNTAAPVSGFTENFSIDLGCIGCKVGLNVAGGAIIAGIIAAGVVVGPETVGVAAIASFFGVDVSSVVSVLNAAVSAGEGTSVEEVISSLCQSFGAC